MTRIAAGALLLAACGRSSTPSPAPAERPVVVAEPTAVPAAPAPPPPPATPACSGGDDVEQVITAPGGGAIACMRATGARDCWSIGVDGTVVALAPDAWPAPPAKADDAITAPAGWSAKPLRRDDDTFEAVEVCGPTGCERIAFARTRNELDDGVAGIAIAPDATTIAIDRGFVEMSPSKLELYALGPVKRLATLAIRDAACANLLGWYGATLIVQGFDCANHGGSRALFDRRGKRLATVLTVNRDWFSFGDPVVALPGDRVLFVDSYGLQIHDLVRGKRIATADNPFREERVEAGATSTGAIVLVDHAGAIAILDAALAETARTRIPRCPAPANP